MIENTAEKLADAFVSHGLIPEGQKGAYVYTLICLAESCLSMLSIWLIGITGKVFWQTMVFCCFFFGLRKRTGGFHLQTFGGCYAATVLLYICIMFGNTVLVRRPSVVLVAAFLSGIAIIVFGNVNHPNMNMTAGEVKAAKKTSRFLVCTELLIIVFMMREHVPFSYVSYACSGVILCAFFMVVGKLTGQEVKNSE